MDKTTYHIRIVDDQGKEYEPPKIGNAENIFQSRAGAAETARAAKKKNLINNRYRYKIRKQINY